MKSNNMRSLTKAEEEVMLILWRIKEGFVKDIIAEMEEPRPAYNTVSTIVRILQDKGFVDHNSFGKSHRYFPVIDKKDYSHFQLKNLTRGYFSNSISKLMSFLAEEEDLNIREIEEIKKIIQEKKK